jgi:hypothetical protein
MMAIQHSINNSSIIQLLNEKEKAVFRQIHTLDMSLYYSCLAFIAVGYYVVELVG